MQKKLIPNKSKVIKAIQAVFINLYYWIQNSSRVCDFRRKSPERGVPFDWSLGTIPLNFDLNWSVTDEVMLALYVSLGWIVKRLLIFQNFFV